MKNTNKYNGLEVAIIGMTGRFPGADNLEQFWQNLRDGVESISTINDEELQKNGVEPDLIQHPDYKKIAATIEDIELFDADFFDISPREAEILDPQQRLFLEAAWTALENAGYNPNNYSGAIGVYAGSAINSYLFNLISNPTIQNNVSRYQLFLANDKDFLTTRISYKLNLRGPSIDIQTACSTSLVAVHIACQSLLSGECDMALTGGVSLSKPTGYLYQEGGIYSPDGHCRAFDAEAQGTISGNGLGIVVLKRLQDALDDNDYIHAVIKGSAINNDGGLKVSYTAPRIDTQAAVIRTAQAVAEVNPETITYIETHGTGTALGDPIEIAALTQAFSAVTNKTGFCGIASVKTNIGHLDTAAGIASLIKTAIALQHKQIPPSLHFQRPNPQINFEQTPFYVNTKLTNWETNNTPRRAGVSSFGIGGTNAHVILEEAPIPTPSSVSRPWQLLLLSAKTPAALTAATENLTYYLQQYSDLNLADVAYTLKVGRQNFEHRRMILCQTTQEVGENLSFTKLSSVPEISPTVTFLFPGQGSQYVNMGKDLYDSELVFKQHFDHCCELLKPHLDLDLQNIIYPPSPPLPLSPSLFQTAYTQPALFIIEYALAQLWMSWGIQPQGMIGHSIGEYVAATLAGVFSLADALKLVAIRGKLMQQCPIGAMLAVGMSAETLQPLLLDDLVISVNNAPELCVVSGSDRAIEQLEKKLSKDNIFCRRLHTSHAFHSPLMDRAIAPFVAEFSGIKLNPPQIPFISNVTGDWITTEQAINPNYWGNHLRESVQFAPGIAKLVAAPNHIFLEVGVGNTLSKLVKQQTQTHTVLSSIRNFQENQSDVAFLLEILGQLWLTGISINWSAFYSQEQRHRVPLPTYPFQRQRYWVDGENISYQTDSKSEIQNPSDWFYIPSWERSLPHPKIDLSQQKHCWLVLADFHELGTEIIQILQAAGHDVIIVNRGEKYHQPTYRTFTVNPLSSNDFGELFEDLELRELLPQQILYLWGFDSEHHEDTQNFPYLQGLAQVIETFSNKINTVQMTIVTNDGQLVIGNEKINPMNAIALGMSKVISQEIPSINCRCVDISSSETSNYKQLAQQLIIESLTFTTETVIAYRGNHRWQQIFKPAQINSSPRKSSLQSEGVYLIVGDMTTGLGTVFAELLPTVSSSDPNHENDVTQTKLKLGIISNEIPETLKIILDKLPIENIYINVDITNQQQFQQAISSIENKLGQINGVFYSTPMSNENSMALLSQLTTENWEYNYRTKIQGLFVLAETFHNKPLDFCLLQSSLSSILGGLGLAAYAAANAVIDAFTVQQNQNTTFPWISINWDACRSDEETVINQGFAANLAALALTPQEVWNTTRKILDWGLAESVIVSKANLQQRLKQWVTQKPSITETSTEITHTRPQLTNDYVAPSNEIESAIAQIWQNLLGIAPIGIHDSFFDLGGHSLMAIQAISRIRDRFGVELSMRNLLYEAPTIAGIATFITAQQPAPENLDEMNALLTEIQNLSPEEIAQQLAM